MLEPVDWVQAIAGSALFLLPGAVWTQVMAPSLAWPHKVPTALVFAFTFEPGVLFVLHLFFGLPLSLGTHVFLSATLAVFGAGLLARRAVRTRHHNAT